MCSLVSADARIDYEDTGSGDPVVLVHCSSASGSQWRALSASLAGRFRCIVPDQWQCGGSDPWHGRTAFSLAEEAAPILAIIDRIGEPVHLVGHSYGGGVALRVAREHPHMIRSLTLIEPSAFHLLRRGARALFREISGVARHVERAVAGGDYWQGMARFVDYWSGTGAWEAMAHDLRARLCQRLPKVVLDFRALFDEPATLDDYRRLDMPTLLVCGTRSPGPSRRIVGMLAGALPRAGATHVAGAGHMSPLTHVDAVNAAIIAHLEANAGKGRRMAA